MTDQVPDPFSYREQQSLEEAFSLFEMPKTFRIKKWTKILLTIAAPFMIALFVWMLLLPVLQPNDAMNKAYWFLALISVSMIVVFIIGIVDTWKSKLIISRNGINIYDFRGSRELLLAEMKGYRIVEKYLFIEPVSDSAKRIKITKYYEDIEAIIAWLGWHLPNLDTVNLLEEHKEILSDDTYGLSVEEREAKLRLAKKVSTAINIAGGAAAAWLVIWPGQYAVIGCILLPLIALAAIKYFKGLIHVDEKKGSAHPSVSIGILLASCVLLFKGVAGYNIFNYSAIWIPAFTITIVYLFLLLQGNKEFKKPKQYFSAIILAAFLFGYGYGAVVNINCAFDNSIPAEYNTQVISKRISRGKSTTYYLELAPWGPQTEKDEVSVSKAMYNLVSENETVHVYFKKGLFDIPWFSVERF